MRIRRRKVKNSEEMVTIGGGRERKSGREKKRLRKESRKCIRKKRRKYEY